MPSTATTPQAVSRLLRSAGMLPVPPNRRGLHVSRSRLEVKLHADTDTRHRNYRLLADAIEVLTSRGYRVERNALSPDSIAYVSKP